MMVDKYETEINDAIRTVARIATHKALYAAVADSAIIALRPIENEVDDATGIDRETRVALYDATHAALKGDK